MLVTHLFDIELMSDRVYARVKDWLLEDYTGHISIREVVRDADLEPEDPLLVKPLSDEENPKPCGRAGCGRDAVYPGQSLLQQQLELS